eukprot:1471513-Rhodomonas_salina.1
MDRVARVPVSAYLGRARTRAASPRPSPAHTPTARPAMAAPLPVHRACVTRWYLCVGVGVCVCVCLWRQELVTACWHSTQETGPQAQPRPEREGASGGKRQRKTTKNKTTRRADSCGKKRECRAPRRSREGLGKERKARGGKAAAAGSGGRAGRHRRKPCRLS